MRETTPAAMPLCFDRWCRKFDDLFKTKAQKTGFRHYLGGLLGESSRKNLTQMADNAVGVVYNRLHHFLTDAPWDATQINQHGRCVLVMLVAGEIAPVVREGDRLSGKVFRQVLRGLRW